MSIRFFSVALIFSLYFLSLVEQRSSLPIIGATYSAKTRTTGGGHQQQPRGVVKAIEALKLTSVRLEDSDPTLIRAFSYTNTTLLLTIPNFMVPHIAGNRSIALRWLYVHVVPFYPRSKITTISVGNDLLDSFPQFSTFLLPAIRNVYLALHDLGIQKISVSTSFSFVAIMTTTFPPSAARFQESVSEVIRPLLQFLHDTNSSFLINLYPYNLYRLNSEIPIGYTLFQEHAFNFRDDILTGVRYRNLFDMMVDAVISAMAVAGHENIPVIVTETGWPSSATDSGEVEANKGYAEMYLKGLVSHMKSGLGTPLRKEGVAEIYIYELFDEDGENNTQCNRNWGIMYPNFTKKYNIDFSGSAMIGRDTILFEMASGLFLGLALTLSSPSFSGFGL